MSQSKENIGLLWYSTNLRTNDLPSLTEAQKNHSKIVAVYFFDPRNYSTTLHGFQKTGKFRTQFLVESLQDLNKQLESLNIPFIVIKGKPEDELPKIIDTYFITSIYLQKEWTLEEMQVVETCKSKIPNEVLWSFQHDQFLIPPSNSGFSNLEDLPFVFTDFRKKIEKNIHVPKIQPTPKPLKPFLKLETQIPDISTFGFLPISKDHRSAFPLKGGTQAGMERLNTYFWKENKVSFYKKTRNRLIGINYSTKLSPYLALGCISTPQIYWELKKYELEVTANESTYWVFFEMLWRDFFKYTAIQYGNRFFLKEGLRNNAPSFNHDRNKIQQWINGHTNDEFVNANMIELATTGWMSNRGRQNVASYFVHDLQQDWTIGAAYFESQLIDYDVHSNYGNWMYVAGVGNDPINRKFNTQLQAKSYDPNGSYRALWLQNELTFND